MCTTSKLRIVQFRIFPYIILTKLYLFTRLIYLFTRLIEIYLLFQNIY